MRETESSGGWCLIYDFPDKLPTLGTYYTVHALPIKSPPYRVGSRLTAHLATIAQKQAYLTWAWTVEPSRAVGLLVVTSHSLKASRISSALDGKVNGRV